MGQRPHSDEQLKAVADAYIAAGRNASLAARIADVSRTTFHSQLVEAARRGFVGTDPVMPGFRISQVTTGRDGKPVGIQQKPEHGEEFEVPAGHLIKGVSALVDPEGREIVKWIKTKEGDGLDIVAALENAFKDYEGRSTPVKPPAKVASHLLTLVPCGDWHLNLLAWSREVGENWDLKIAERVIGEAIDEAIEGSPASEIGVVLGGGDLVHADTDENRTAKSGHVLDADGRHQKALEVAQRLKVRTIDAAKRKFKRVIVRVLKGNHDEYTSVAVGHFLSAWYRNDRRVTVDLDASLFWWYRFGDVFLGATHGHTVKLKDMPQIMAHRRAEDWGKSKFRYIHGFHIHHTSKIATEGGGVIAESHQAPIPQDGWHYGAGYLSGRSVKTITYHERFGERGRKIVAILDGSKAR